MVASMKVAEKLVEQVEASRKSIEVLLAAAEASMRVVEVQNQIRGQCCSLCLLPSLFLTLYLGSEVEGKEGVVVLGRPGGMC